MKLIIAIILTLPLAMNAQDLKKHKWENRLIVISSPTFNNEEAAIQKRYLQTQIEELEDRKLIVYHFTNDGYTVGFNEKIVTLKNSAFNSTEFNVSLIGLDGSEKFKESSAQPASQFFKLIDAMPMRRAEKGN
jgi:hypothetical protein